MYNLCVEVPRLCTVMSGGTSSKRESSCMAEHVDMGAARQVEGEGAQQGGHIQPRALLSFHGSFFMPPATPLQRPKHHNDEHLQILCFVSHPNSVQTLHDMKWAAPQLHCLQSSFVKCYYIPSPVGYAGSCSFLLFFQQSA